MKHRVQAFQANNSPAQWMAVNEVTEQVNKFLESADDNPKVAIISVDYITNVVSRGGASNLYSVSALVHYTSADQTDSFNSSLDSLLDGYLYPN